MPEVRPPGVESVLGWLPGDGLGVVSAHEHVLVDLLKGRPSPDLRDDPDRALVEAPVALDTLWWVRENYTRSLDNNHLRDEVTAVAELTRYRRAGGGTIVDATPVGIGRDPEGLRRVAAASGVNIVMGSGYYVRPYHPASIATTSREAIADEIERDLTVGVDGTTIRSGIIGEIGCSWPLDRDERKVLEAAAVVQRRTGAGLLIHPGRHPHAALDHVRVAEAWGADPGRTVVSHVDRRISRRDDLRALANSGCFIEFDCFGLEPWLDPETSICPMPCDLERIDLILWLIEAGLLGQVLIAQDIAMKHRLVTYGGHGYDHILRYVVPILRSRGCSTREIDQLLIDNPRRALEQEANRP